MRPYTLILLLAITSVALMDIVQPVQLFPTKNSMTAQDYIDRSEFISNLYSKFPIQGSEASFTYSNNSEPGPFRIHWKFSIPKMELYSVQLSALIQINNSEDSGIIANTLASPYGLFIPIQLFRNTSENSQYDFYIELDINYIEKYFIKAESGNYYTFCTQIKLFYNSTENEIYSNLLEVLSLVYLKRPISIPDNSPIEGSYNIKIQSLTSDVEKINIDLSIKASLFVCVDPSPSDLTTCEPRQDPVSFQLNQLGKFMLSLDDEDFANIYYLRKQKISLKRSDVEGEIDFTIATTSPTEKKLGKLIFSLNMVMVSEQITITAIATLSTTSNRRMLNASSSKAVVSYTTIGIDNVNSEPIPLPDISYACSFMFFLSFLIFMVFIMI